MRDKMERRFQRTTRRKVVTSTTRESVQPVTSLSGDSRLQLTFNRARADLIYEVLGSSDLVTWSVIATDPGTTGQSVTVTDTTSLTSAPRRFLRLRVRER